MADRKISDLTALTAPASGDYLPIVDISEAAAASKNKRITIEELFRGVPLGTAAAPSIAIEGDENTGIYSPGADQLAISTNGTGRLFVDASGNVATGTSLLFGKPTNANRVSYAGGGYSDTNIPALGLALYRSQTGEHGHLFWSGQSTGGNTRVLGSIRMEQTVATVANGGGDIIFNTNPGTAEQPTERLRITSAGELQFKGAGTNGSPGSPAVSFNGSAPSNSLVIDSSGRVGLGTSSPGTALDVTGAVRASGSSYNPTVGNSWTTGAAHISNGAYGGGLSFIDGTNGFTAYLINAGAELRLAYGATNATPTTGFTFTNTGRLGIGTTSPATLLALQSASPTVRLAPTTANAASSIELGVLNGGVNAYAKIDAINTVNYDTNIRFWTNASGSTTQLERARIDSSGRLLVGTATSRSTAFGNGSLQVEAATPLASITANGANAFGAAYVFAKTRGSSFEAVSNNDNLGIVSWQGANGTALLEAARIDAYVDGAVTGGGANDMPGRLVFSTTADGAASPTERMRISSTGFMLLGTTADIIWNTSSSGVSIGSNSIQISRSGDLALLLNRTTNDGKIQLFARQGVEVGSVSVTTSATAYNTSSDYRLKENIVPLTGAIDRVNQLQVHRFNFIADPDKTVDGFIAHEAQSVVPECVTGEKDAVNEDGSIQPQGIDQSKLVPLLTAALQEAIAKIETLEAKVAALEAS